MTFDAKAICKVASRRAMQFVTLKTESKQTLSALQRVQNAPILDPVEALRKHDLPPAHIFPDARVESQQCAQRQAWREAGILALPHIYPKSGKGNDG